MIDQPRRPHSRLARQENKRMVRQTILIVVATIVLMVAFVTYGISGLLRLAVVFGNAKNTSKFASQEDKLPLLQPTLNAPPEATSSATISLSGFAEAGSVVTLFSNGTQVTQSTTDNQGNFTFTDITLDKGPNGLTVTATDTAGNQSPPSRTQTVTYNNEPPKLNIDQPQDGARVVGNYNQLITVAGSTDPNVEVTLNDRQLVVIGDGSFSTQFQLQDGDNKLTFKATDKAANQTTKEITVNFSR